MTVLTAQPTIYMTPNSTRNIAVSFVGQLAANDLLSGTPTVAISPSGAGCPTLSSAAVNSATMLMEVPDNEHYAKAGQAVTFTVACSSATAQTYTVTVTGSTSGGQTLQEYVTIVVSAS
jgi:hypothetical protein